MAILGVALSLWAGAAWADEALVNAAGARVRAEPSITAKEVTRLGLGQTVQAFEQTGAGPEAWRRVETPAGAGWMAARFLEPVDPARRDQALLALAQRRLAAEADQPFGDSVELTKRMEEAAAAARDPQTRGAYALYALMALDRAVRVIPMDAKTPAQEAWLKAYEGRVVYSEPSGEWYVRADEVWNLEKAYRGSPIGERIAWEASRINLPGECEGYLPCYLGYTQMTDGEYLDRYPTGAHAAEALKAIEDFLRGAIKDFDTGSGNREFGDYGREFPQGVAAMRKTLARVPGSANALAALAALEKKAK